VILTRTNSTAPMWEAGQTYKLAHASVDFSVLSLDPDQNNDRNTARDFAQHDFNSTSPPEYLVIPNNFINTCNATYNDGDIEVMCGRSMVILHDPDDDFSDAPNATDPTDSGDSDLFLTKYETGAMLGNFIDGGEIQWANNQSKRLYELPASIVAFASKNGTAAPSYKGKLNFIARSNDGGGVIQEVPDFTRGDITIDTETGNGTMNILYIDSDNYSTDATNIPLKVEKLAGTGLLHIYNDDPIDYTVDSNEKDAAWDIYWPIGSPRGVYFFSVEDSNDQLRVNEIGDFFVDF